MKSDELEEILRLHFAWLRCARAGVRADLSDADLRMANLRMAKLHGAKLRGADLREAKLRMAKLTEAELSGADLRKADLRKADLRKADLSGAYMHGADLTDAAGVAWAVCGWSAYGEFERTLLAVADQDGPGVDVYHCGCFRGTLADLRSYIANGEARYATTRTLAADFCAARLEEMKQHDKR